MKIGPRGFGIGFVLSVIIVIYGFATLSFDALNYDIFLGVFLMAFIYMSYAIVFFSAVYHQEIFDKTIKKGERKIEKVLDCVTTRKDVLRLMDLSAIASYLILALISTTAPQVFLSAIPGDEFLQLILSYLMEIDKLENISVPYISSLKFLMLACIGPMIVFVLRITHILKLDKENKIKKQSKKQSKTETNEIKNKFPGVRAFTIFLFVAPVILIISRIFTSQPIVFDFTLAALMLLGFVSWFIAWFMQAFESMIFANLLKK